VPLHLLCAAVFYCLLCLRKQSGATTPRPCTVILQS